MVYKKSDTESRKRRKREGTAETTTPTPLPTTVCYCDGERELGTLEVHCTICRKWFHSKCLKDLTEFYGLPFMVCYVFKCKDCSPDKKESWSPKQTNFSHMCVMALANMTFNYHSKTDGKLEKLIHPDPDCELTYFHFENDVVPYFDENWESLTNIPRRVKTSWHQTLQKTLLKETDLFAVHPNDENLFALKERNLFDIGPLLESIKKLGKRPPASQPIKTADSDNDEDSGPKTRNAMKRRAESSSRTSSMTPTKASTPASTVEGPPAKIQKNGSEKPIGILKKGTLDANAVVEGSDGLINFPFNREGMQYFFAEKDIHVKEKDLFDKVEAEQAEHIPSHIYRRQLPTRVTLSINDRAYQTELGEDRLTVTGDQGYVVARATHNVIYGKWYYEVEFVNQPEGSHARIGWGQNLAHLQACLGYSKFSYGWRSLKGTKFHNAHGYTYFREGYKQGDVLGCLIELPEREEAEDKTKLQSCKKDCRLLNFKGNIFFEEKEEIEQAEKQLKILPNSKISFYKNGKFCGAAYENIYDGAYFPAISVFQKATLRCNFGHNFKYPIPEGARAMCERADEMAIELALSDIEYLIEKRDSLEDETRTRLQYFNIL